MTREKNFNECAVSKDELSLRIEVEKAFLAGEPIEWHDRLTDHWYETDTPCWDWTNTKYRIGIKRHYVPLTIEDLTSRATSGKSMWFYNNGGSLECVAVIKASGILTATGKRYHYEDMMNFSFIDGVKCCKEERLEPVQENN